MNQLTVVDRGGVKHPEIVTIDEVQNLLDQYGTGGKAVKIPGGVNLRKFLGRCDGGFYYDNAARSGTTGGPIKDIVYYTVLSGGIPGSRAIIASSHGNDLWIAEVYGDVFRGWVNFARPDDVKNWISTAIDTHEKSRNHPYATESEIGFVQLAKDWEAAAGEENTHVMTALRSQNLLDTYGIGARSNYVPDGSNLTTFFNDKKPGFYRLYNPTTSKYTGHPTDVAFTWAEIIVTNHENLNQRAMLLITNTGRTYSATVNSGSFSGWKLKLQMDDLPVASLTQRGIVQLTNSVTSTDNTTAATPNSVKAANDNANTRVPLTRTVNGKALSSDIVITAADVGAWSKAEADARYLFKWDTPLPIGMPIPWGRATAPEGFFIMAGQGLSAAYPKLQSVYGGALPDLRGLIIRGTDLGRGVDPGRGVLSYQDDAMQQIYGTFPCFTRWRAHEKITGVFTRVDGQWNTNIKNGNGDDWGMTFVFDSARVVRTAAETRMKNLAFTYIVKAE